MKIFEAILLANAVSSYHIEPIYVMTSSRDISRKEKEKEFQEYARAAAILSNKKDPNEFPSIGFYRDYDHMGYDS